MALNVPSPEVLNKIVNRLVEKNVVTPEDLNNIAYLQKKKQKVFRKWSDWQIQNKEFKGTSSFKRTDNAFLRDQAEIALDIKIKQADFARRNNYVKRLNTYVKSLLIFEGREELTLSNSVISFKDVCYALLVAAKNQSIEELELDNKVIISKLSFEDYYSIEKDNKYYLNSEQEEKLREREKSNNQRIEELKALSLKKKDLVSSDITFEKLIHSKAIDVFDALSSTLLEKKEEEKQSPYNQLLEILNEAVDESEIPNPKVVK